MTIDLSTTPEPSDSDDQDHGESTSTEARAQPEPAQDELLEPGTYPILHKSIPLAILLSFMPGIGHVYNGLYRRALLFFGVFLGAAAIMVRNEIFTPVVVFIWLFNVIDTYRQATLINLGYSADLGLLEDRPDLPRSGQGTFYAGVALLVFGVIAALDVFFGLSIEPILEAWPLFLVAAGIWLIIRSLRERQR